jgi:hypothetical protein
MKKRILIIILFVISCNLYGQYKLKRFVPSVGNSDFILTKDENEIKFNIPDTIAKNVGIKLLKEMSNKKLYLGGKFLSAYNVSFTRINLRFAVSTSILYKDSIYRIMPSEDLYIFGFTSTTIEKGKASRNISTFFMSAYLQETNKDYANNMTCMRLYPKDKKEYWKRNWINMGYGISYALKDNPFVSGKGAYIGFAYAWEAFHYFMILGGPFLGRTSKDKIEISLIGVCSLFLWKKYLLGGQFSGIINNYNNIVNSKYKIPNNLDY